MDTGLKFYAHLVSGLAYGNRLRYLNNTWYVYKPDTIMVPFAILAFMHYGTIFSQLSREHACTIILYFQAGI